jgi:hypothetical protein
MFRSLSHLSAPLSPPIESIPAGFNTKDSPVRSSTCALSVDSDQQVSVPLREGGIAVVETGHDREKFDKKQKRSTLSSPSFFLPCAL